MTSFVLTTEIAAPIDECFAMSLSIDAHMGSMRSSDERAIAGVTSGEIGPGETVTWSARHFWIWFRLKSRITDYERPSRFTDEQISGPFRRWRHEHEFQETVQGTCMIDRIDFDAPFGFVGRAVEKLILARYMQRLIERRNDWLREALERG